MPLTRRLTLLLVSAVALSLAGGVLGSLWTVRDTLRSEWLLRNGDAAAMLALALSSRAGDASLMTHEASLRFEAGRYRRVGLRAPDGALLFERKAPAAGGMAPAWFVAALPISARPGVGVVSDGTRTVASVEVESDPAWLRDALWSGLLRSTAWLVAVALLALAGAGLALRYWFGGLEALVAQAQALKEGRFVEVAEPAKGEFRHLAAGTNAAVRRLRALFEAQADQLERFRLQAQVDALTGLSNRGHFMAQLERALVVKEDRTAKPDAPCRGSLLIVRLNKLEAMNKRVGHETVDRMLASMSEVLLAYPRRVDGAFAGRLSGGDLGLYLPVNGVARETAEALRATLSVSLGAIDNATGVAIGGVDRLPTGNVSMALARADEALARAESAGGFAVDVCDSSDEPAHGESEWRQRIASALTAGRFALSEFPVVDPSGHLIQLECPLRIRLNEGGEFAAAAQWLPMATRGQQTQKVDLAATELALRAIARDGRARCVHVAARSLADPGFAHEVARLLSTTAAPARLLSVEVDEAAALHGRRWRDAAQLWRPFGLRLGVESAGGSLHTLGAAPCGGLDYLKVDARFVRGVAKDPSLAQYARQIVATAHGVGVVVYASGVDDQLDLTRLWELGFDGATGPAVCAPG